MGRKDDHLSASATQIYPPQASPAQSSSETHSDLHLNPAFENDHEVDYDGSTRRVRSLDLARLVLMVLSIAIAAAAVGCEAHTLNVYNTTRLDAEFFLPPLWPKNFDLRPTQGMVVGGAVAALVGLVYVLVGVVPLVSCSSEPFLRGSLGRT
jgi:hypothetical protein